MRRGIPAAGLLGAALCLAPAADAAPDRTIYDPSRDPFRDLAVAVVEARGEDKRILLRVGGNWCGWCQEFERFLRADGELGDALRCAFVVVHVNVSPENSNARFLSRYPGVPGYPYLFVLDPDGSLLRAVDTDEFLEGQAYDRNKVLAFARRWEPAPRRSQAEGR